MINHTSRHILPLCLTALMLCVCITSISASPSEQLPRTLGRALSMLDYEMGRKESYSDMRLASVDSLKTLLAVATTADSIRLAERIAAGYDAFNVDSCMVYYRIGADVARRSGDSIAAQRMSFMRYALMPVSGMIREAIAGFESLRGRVYRPNRPAFFIAGNRMTSFSADLYPPSQIRDTYLSTSAALADSVCRYIPANDPTSALMKAQMAGFAGDNATEVALLTDIVEHLPMDNNLFARAASQLGQHYQNRGQIEKAAYFYALSSISDIRTGTLEGVAMLRLGALLYDLDDLDRSFRLINEALDASARSGAKIRAMEAYQVLPKVSKAFTYEDNRRMRWLTGLAVSLVIALAVIIAVMLRLRRERDSLRRLQKRLADANASKEHNISRFLDLTSIYADRLEEFMRLARRKITTGQVDDLNNLIKSGNVARNQTRLFCELFDNAFLHLYPDFVAEVNKLLAPDRQLVQPSPHQLDAETRILAFQRLGIDDSARISRFLGLSVNTVYTYRNKTRNRAVDRNSFESDLMATGAIG